MSRRPSGRWSSLRRGILHDGERELRRRLPSAQIVHVEEAGHSLQGDTPLELAAIIERFAG